MNPNFGAVFTPVNLTAFALVVLSAVVHELCHGLVANKLGDPTAKQAGRLTLNPLVHLDPIGSVLWPLMFMMITGGAFFFASAKPIPVQPEHLRHPRRDLSLVAAAGPLSNWVLALLAYTVAFAALTFFGATHGGFLWKVCTKFAFLSLFFVILNLVPVPPLDGYKIIRFALPRAIASRLDRIEMFGILIVLGLLIWPVTGIWFQRAVDWLMPTVVWPLDVFQWLAPNGNR